jgi:hypothetical protein
VFDWLFEGRAVVYVPLTLLALALAFIWYSYGRRRAFLYAAGVMVVLIGVYALLDRLVETRREQIERKLHEMARGVKDKNVDAIFRHISDQFDYKGINKATFRTGAAARMRTGWVDKLDIWRIEHLDDQGKVRFQAKPHGRVGENVGTGVEAQFVNENGQWRLRSFKVFNPFVDTNQEIDVSEYLRD